MISSQVLQAFEDTFMVRPLAHLPELPDSGVSLSRWRRVDSSRSHLFKPPQNWYTLSLILQPMEARAWFGTRQVWSGSIGANMIRLTPPGIEPSWASDGAFDFLLFTIPSETIDRIAGDSAVEVHDALRRSHPFYVRDEVVTQFGRNMLRAAESTRRFAAKCADGLGFALVAHLLDRYVDDAPDLAQPRLSPHSLKRIRQYVTSHLCEEIRVGDLAAVAELSVSHFAHAFRASTGQAPHSFVNSMRIEHAHRLLLEGRLSVCQIAVECGFKDGSHFARVFRASTGMNPRQFRLANRR
jgi:AraC family transcriptional regulator